MYASVVPTHHQNLAFLVTGLLQVVIMVAKEPGLGKEGFVQLQGDMRIEFFINKV